VKLVYIHVLGYEVDFGHGFSFGAVPKVFRKHKLVLLIQASGDDPMINNIRSHIGI
jgi:hypothetical protein